MFCGVNTVDVHIVTLLAKLQSDSHLSGIMGSEDSRINVVCKDFSTFTDLRPISQGGSGAMRFHCFKRVKCQIQEG